MQVFSFKKNNIWFIDALLDSWCCSCCVRAGGDYAIFWTTYSSVTIKQSTANQPHVSTATCTLYEEAGRGSASENICRPSVIENTF